MNSEFSKISASSITDRGLSEKRPQNEDSYLEMTEYGLFAVADGVGGAQAGDVASQMAIETLSEAFINTNSAIDAEELLEAAILKANEAIFQAAEYLPQLATMATTIVALHIADNIATIGHAGDSRLYRFDSAGNLFRETDDHSFVEDEFRAGRLTSEQVANHPNKNIISRALGIDKSVEIEMKTIMFEPNTSFLLCSDGVTRHISDEEISGLLKSAESLEKVCRQIKETCYARGAEDNLTAVVVRVSAPSAEAQSAADLQTDDLEEETITAVNPTFAKSGFAPDEARTLEIPIEKNDDEAPDETDLVPTDDELIEISKHETEVSSVESTPSAAAEDEIENSKNAPLSESNEAPANGKLFWTEKPELLPDVPSKTRNIIYALLGVLLGALLGAAGFYFWTKAQPKPEIPVLSKFETPNISYTAFENSRRDVDKNPAQFIATAAATAEDAEDFYLLGRAFLLSGKYDEAKAAFAKAKGLLPAVASNDREMLAAEINFGLALTATPETFKSFEAIKNGN